MPRNLLSISTMVVATTLIVACNSNDSTSPRQATTADRAFIDGMVPHHGQAMLSADMAIARAVHPELKQFATNMKADQGREIDSLKARKLAWFGTDSTPTPMMPADIPAGPNFDLQWIKMMLTHHEGAVDMSQLLLSGDARIEDDTLAQHIITEQRSEQQQLRTWAQQWYGVTPSIAPRQ